MATYIEESLRSSSAGLLLAVLVLGLKCLSNKPRISRYAAKIFSEVVGELTEELAVNCCTLVSISLQED